MYGMSILGMMSCSVLRKWGNGASTAAWTGYAQKVPRPGGQGKKKSSF